MNKVDLSRYSKEVEILDGYLKDLKEGKIRKISGNTTHQSHDRMAERIEESVNDLLSKILNEKEGFYEELAKIDKIKQ